MKQQNNKTISLIFGYMFSALGLVLLVIGSIGMLNLFLKQSIFTGADQDYYLYQPPTPYFSERIKVLETCEDMNEQEILLAKQWLKDYETWTLNADKLTRKSINHETASKNLALIIVGLPLFLWSFRFVRKNDS